MSTSYQTKQPASNTTQQQQAATPVRTDAAQVSEPAPNDSLAPNHSFGKMAVSPGSTPDNAPENEKKDKEDKIDRSFLGLGYDDKTAGGTEFRKKDQDENQQDQNSKPPSSELISTAEDDKDAFNKLAAQRGNDLVDDLRRGIVKREAKLKELNENLLSTSDSDEKTNIEAEIKKTKKSLDLTKRRLEMISFPQLRDLNQLETSKSQLEKELNGDIKPGRKKTLQRKLTDLQEQIDAVKQAHANPNEPAPLAAYEGVDFGIPLKGAKTTYVTIQVQTADGEIHSFQTKNVPGGDHAEDVAIAQIKRQVKDLKGAKMTIFGDQEVCERCQKRVPEFAETHGIKSVEGYTTHAPALNKDELLKAKSTMLELTNPEQINKREKYQQQQQKQQPQSQQQQAHAEDIPKKLQLKQQKTFDWQSPHPEHVPVPAPKTNTDPSSTPKPQAKTPPQHTEDNQKPPVSRSESITDKLNKADMALSAIRDFQNYKKELMAKGMSESDANIRAAARAGISLGANMKGGPAASIVNGINAFVNANEAGQGKDEALSTAFGTVAGGHLANKLAPTGPAGAAVQLLNTAAQVAGAPQGVQDVTYGAAELVPSNIVSTTVVAGARSWYALGKAATTGDTKGIDKLGKEMESGGLGPWLQGYAQVTGMVANMAAGDDFSKALNKAADSGKGSWGDRVGSQLGDAAFNFGQDKEAMAGKYGPVAGGYAIALNIAAGMARGDDFKTAFKHTQKDFAEGKKTLNVKIDQKVEQAKAIVHTKIDDTKKQVKAKIQDTSTAIKAKAAATEQHIKEGFSEVAQNLSAMKEKTSEKLNQMTDTVHQTAVETVSAVKDQIQAGEDLVKNKLASAKNLASQYLPKIW